MEIKWSDRVNQNETYKVQGSSVYGNGSRYNLTNNVTAVELCNTLNNLTEYKNQSNKTETQLDQITKQIIQLKLTINILGEEITKLVEMMK